MGVRRASLGRGDDLAANPSGRLSGLEAPEAVEASYVEHRARDLPAHAARSHALFGAWSLETERYARMETALGIIPRTGMDRGVSRPITPTLRAAPRQNWRRTDSRPSLFRTAEDRPGGLGSHRVQPLTKSDQRACVLAFTPAHSLLGRCFEARPDRSPIPAPCRNLPLEPRVALPVVDNEGFLVAHIDRASQFLSKTLAGQQAFFRIGQLGP